MYLNIKKWCHRIKLIHVSFFFFCLFCFLFVFLILQSDSVDIFLPVLKTCLAIFLSVFFFSFFFFLNNNNNNNNLLTSLKTFYFPDLCILHKKIPRRKFFFFFFFFFFNLNFLKNKCENVGRFHLRTLRQSF